MAKLGDICSIVSGTTPKSNRPEYWDGDINWVTPAELNDDSDVIYESQRKITEQAVRDSSLKPFPVGTVLLSSRAPIGKVAIAGVEMYCNQGFKNLICSNRIYNRYLYHFLKNSTEYLNSLGRGATFKEISKSIVENIEIPLPSLDEQRRIAAVLDKISGLIANRRAQLAKLDELVKARFVEMFGDPEFNLRNWPIVSLSDVCTVGSSKRIYQSEQTFDGVPFLRISDLNHLIDTGDFFFFLFISEEKYQELQQHGQVPIEGDILVTSRGTLGRCYIIKTTDRFYFQDGMISWISNLSNEITSLFIAYLFDMQSIKRQIESMQAGSTVSYLSIDMIKRLKIMLPDRNLQKQFGAFVDQTNKSKLTIQQSLDKLEVLKKALMQQYFE